MKEKKGKYEKNGERKKKEWKDREGQEQSKGGNRIGGDGEAWKEKGEGKVNEEGTE